MEIISKAMAGTVESSDCLVYVEPSTAQKIEVEVESVVKAQYGSAILKAIEDTLAEQKVSAAKIFLKDRGALDCVIKARVETALKRAQGGAVK